MLFIILTSYFFNNLQQRSLPLRLLSFSVILAWNDDLFGFHFFCVVLWLRIIFQRIVATLSSRKPLLSSAA